MTEYLDCYIRVSSKEQSKGQSLDTQTQYGKKVAKKLGLKFRPRNEGAKSSTKGYREVLEEVKEEIEKGVVKHLWVIDRSRLFRDETDSSLFRRNYLETYGVNFYESETGNLCNFDSLEEKLSYDIVSKLQQYENEKRSHKSKQGKRHLLEQGIENRHYGGTVLFGYKSVNGVLHVDDEESKWVLFMFNSVLEGKTIMEIKKDLDLSLVNPKRTKSGTWNLGTIQKMLSNRSYIGEKEFHDKELDKTFKYNITPIITRRTFFRVRKEMESRKKNNDNNKKHISLFGDFLVCECGERMSSEVKKGTRKNGISYNTKTYHCVSKMRKWKLGIKSNCNNVKSMNMDMTDFFLTEKITSVVKNSVLLKEKFKTDVLNKKYDQNKNIEERQKKLESKCKRLIKRQEQTYSNIITMETELVQGRKEEKIVKGILKNLNSELDSLKEELNKTELEIENTNDEKYWIDWLEKYGDDLELKVNDNIETKRDWLKGLINKIVVKVEQDKNRDGKIVQVGHKFEVFFKMEIVNDKLVYNNPDKKSQGYTIKKGRKKLSPNPVNLKRSRGKKIITLLNYSVTVE